MANPFAEMFPDSKCVNTIQVNVPIEVYRRVANEAHEKDMSISQVMNECLKTVLFPPTKSNDTSHHTS